MSSNISSLVQGAPMPGATAAPAATVKSAPQARAPQAIAPITPKVTQQQEAELKPEVMQRRLESAVLELNAQMAKTGRSLGFSYDEAAGQSVIRVINKDTGAVLRQMPGDAVLSVAHSIESLKGILYSNLA